MRLRNFLPLALLIVGSFWSAPLLAQEAAAAATSSPGLLENPSMETNYILLAILVRISHAARKPIRTTQNTPIAAARTEVIGRA